MSLIEWTAFGVADSLTRTIVHFFPASSGSGAPYPARCRITLLNGGGEPQSVVLDEARLSQPDGFFIDDVFPALKERTIGFFGFMIALEPSQQRIGVSHSQCIIEFASLGRPVRFRPKEISANVSTNAVALCRDTFLIPSLVVVNKGTEAKEAKPVLRPSTSVGESIEVPVSPMRVEPGMAVEFTLGGDLFASSVADETSWGLVRSAVAEFDAKDSDLVWYALYRDAQTKRPVSVVGV